MRLATKGTETENLFEILANKSPVGLYIVQDGKFCYTNPTFQNTTGYRGDELRGRDSLKLVVPEDKERVRDNAIKMLKGELTTPYQFRVTHKNGSIKWIIESVVTVQYCGRRAALGYFVDITERKQAEEAIQDERNKLQSLIGAMTDALNIVDRDYNLIYQNEPAKRPFGDRTGEKCYLVFEGNKNVCKGCPVEKAFKDGKSHTAERETVTPSGKVIFWENTANPIKDAGGRIVACLEINKDITERKKQEQALADELTRRRLLIDQSLDGIVVLDVDAKVYEANQSFAAMLGYTCEEVRELHLWDWQKNYTHEDLLEMLRNCGEKGLHLETIYTRKDGSVFDVDISTNGAMCGGQKLIFCVCRDITKRKQAEQATQAEKNKLQSLIDAMTEEDHISIRDRDYNLIYLPEYELKRWGDVIGEKCYRVFEGQDKVCDGCPAEQMFKDGKPHTTERSTVLPSGEFVIWENRVSPVRDTEGRIISCLELSRNITERKKAEEVLNKTQTQLSSAVQMAHLGPWEYDAINDLFIFNDAFYELFHTTAEEVGGYTMSSAEYARRFVHPEDAHLVGEEVRKSLQADDPNFSRQLDHRIIYADGEVGYISVHIFIVKDATGRTVRTYGVNQVITERKQAEEAIQAEKNKLQSLIDAMEDHLTIRDRDYNLIYMSERSKKVWGDRIGEKCYRVYEGREKVCDGCPVEMAFKDGRSHIAERKTVPPSGEVIIWENTANLIRDAEGRVISCLEIGRNITERKKQEQALKDSEESYRDSTNSITDIFFAMDEHLRYTYWNKASEILTGIRAEDVVGKSLTEIFPDTPELRNAEKVYRNVLRMQQSQTFVNDFNIDGRHYIFEISAYPSRGGLSVVAKDITERKKMEEAINLQKAYFQQLFGNSPDAIIMMDTNDRAIQVNKGFEKLFGYSDEEAKGRSLIELIVPEEDAQEASNTLQRILNGEVVRKESVRRRKDGSLVDVSLLAYPIPSNDKLVGAYGIYSNITERKQTEEAIKQAAEEWRRTFDSISDAISIHDRDFRILQANKAFADMFHMKPRQIIGKYCYELHSREKPISGCPHQQTLATGRPAAAEFYESHLGKYLRESTSPIFNDKGKVVGTVHITRDITEQKQQNERLMMADRLASIGELAAGTAHELNNPLTSVIGFSQLLMEKDIPDDIREDVKLIYNEARRAADVTKNLLTFARKHAPVKQLTQINNIIVDVLKLRAYEQKVNGIEVKRRLAHDLPEIMVDQFQMQQVFLNIIINAEYFMTEAHNGGTLTITTKKHNGIVRISFADDGPGIPEENLSRIFDPFFTTKEAGKGTGLGLSICHGIVAEHGGQIYAKSQPGKGATFVVELPIESP